MTLTLEQKRARQREYTKQWRIRNPEKVAQAAIKKNERAKAVRAYYRMMNEQEK